jgi:hypothetical protein
VARPVIRLPGNRNQKLRSVGGLAPPIAGVPATIGVDITVNDSWTQEIAIDRRSEGEDMTGLWTRIAALTGVIFALVLVPAVLVTSGSPDSNASAAKVRAYVLTHKNHYSLGALLTILALVFGLFFYGYLRAFFRCLPGDEWLASLFFGGAIIFGVGGALAGGVDAALGDSPASLSAGYLQLLNTMSEDLNVVTLASGLGILYLSAGFIVYRSRALPVWLAWVSWLLGVLAASFVFTFIALVATVLWVLYVSILLASRNPALSASSTESDAISCGARSSVE